MEITVYIQPDGKIAIRWPKGAMPDKQTIERLCDAIRKKSIKEAVA